MGARVEQSEPIDLEARRELVADLGLGAVPGEVLADHLLRVLSGASWPVLRASAAALARRWARAERDGLKLAAKPKGRAVLGDYRTRRPRQAPRPYRTMLRSLEPLETSCDCPDFLLGGLGLCKHALVVLDDLHRHPRRLARARASAAVEVDLSWDPTVALDAADALAGLHWTGARGPSRRIAPLFEPADVHGRAWVGHAWRQREQRAELVDRLRRSIHRRPVEPPVVEILRRERARLDRLADIDLDGRVRASDR